MGANKGDRMADGDISLSTTPPDTRFPNVSQSRHCFSRFNEYNRCVAKQGEEKCAMLKKFYESICPNEWVGRWQEQLEAGTFPGPTFEDGSGKLIHPVQGTIRNENWVNKHGLMLP